MATSLYPGFGAATYASPTLPNYSGSTNLTGAFPSGYTPTSGGVPSVPNPGQSQNQAISGNLANYGGLANLTNQVNQLGIGFANQLNGLNLGQAGANNLLNQNQATWNQNAANQQQQVGQSAANNQTGWQQSFNNQQQALQQQLANLQGKYQQGQNNAQTGWQQDFANQQAALDQLLANSQSQWQQGQYNTQRDAAQAAGNAQSMWQQGQSNNQTQWQNQQNQQIAALQNQMNQAVSEGNNARAQDFAKQIDQLNSQQIRAQQELYVPGLSGLEQQSSANALAELRGEIPQGDVNQLVQGAMQRGTRGGFGAGSPNGNAALMYALGQTAIGQNQRGQADLSAAVGRVPNLPLYTPAFSEANQAQMQAAQSPYAQAPNIQSPFASSQLITAPFAQSPYAQSQYIGTSTANSPYVSAPFAQAGSASAPYASAQPFNPASMLNTPEDYQSAQYAANTLNAAPKPGAVQAANWNSVQNGLGRGYGATAPTQGFGPTAGNNGTQGIVSRYAQTAGVPPPAQAAPTQGWGNANPDAPATNRTGVPDGTWYNTQNDTYNAPGTQNPFADYMPQNQDWSQFQDVLPWYAQDNGE